jgi:6-methylsalicylate decarboxylase
MISGPLRDRRIDVHHHIFPPPYVEAAGARLRAQAPDFAFVLEQWSPERSLEAMRESGVTGAITSLSTPGVFAGNVAAARTLARQCNDFAAGMMRAHSQFGMFATLPMPDVEGSLAEIAYALDVLHADGIGFLSVYGDKWLGDAAFAPIFDELNRRKAIVFVHPSVSTCCAALLPNVPPAVVEFLFDTTRTIVSLLYSGTFTRCPDIRFIFPQDGGTLPMLADRIANSLRRAKLNPSDEGMATLRRLYFDVATSTTPIGLGALLGLVPADHVMFGTDYPFLPMSLTTSGLDASPLSEGQQACINHRTAASLLPRFA